MKVFSHPRIRAVAVVAAGCAVLLAGCVTQPPGRAPTSSSGVTGALAVAQSAFKAGNTASAWQAAKSVSVSALPADQRLAGAELKARIALASGHPNAALTALAAAPKPTASKDQASLLALKGRALFGVDQPARGLELLVNRGQLLTATDQRANNQLIWSLLSATSPLPSPAGLSSTAQGWIALAGIARTAWLEPKELAAQIQKWRASWPDHPANAQIVSQILAKAQGSRQYPVKIALLLPLTGPYADQARAVEEGLLAAYYHGVEPHPTVAIYDTQGSVQGARAAFSQALAGAADFVVGPLAPAGVNAVAAMRPAVPVLALNYLSTGAAAPSHFFQFGLSPFEEARSAAERAAAHGLERAVVLVPANGWGQRIEQAFTQRFEQLGGTVLSSAAFKPGAVHFAAPLTALLGGVPAQPPAGATVPPSANGPQFVFFAASSFDTTQLIVPQIAYYGGINLPVYSISSVYRPGATPDDLDGVNFPIMPWFVDSDAAIASLRQTLKTLYPNRWRNYASLYALGYDAWRLIPLLGFNVNQPLSPPVLGVTGTLGLEANNVIKRRAEWARYVNGRPHVASPPPVPVSTVSPVPATR